MTLSVTIAGNDEVSLNFVKYSLNFEPWQKKGFFEDELTLVFISLAFINAKWMKFKSTFLRSLNKILL